MQPLSFDESNILLINPLAKNKERKSLVAGTEKAELTVFQPGFMTIGYQSNNY